METSNNNSNRKLKDLYPNGSNKSREDKGIDSDGKNGDSESTRSLYKAAGRTASAVSINNDKIEKEAIKQLKIKKDAFNRIKKDLFYYYSDRRQNSVLLQLMTDEDRDASDIKHMAALLEESKRAIDATEQQLINSFYDMENYILHTEIVATALKSVDTKNQNITANTSATPQSSQSLSSDIYPLTELLSTCVQLLMQAASEFAHLRLQVAPLLCPNEEKSKSTFLYSDEDI